MTQKSARKSVCVNRDIQGTILRQMANYWILYHLGLWSILFTVEFLQHIVGGLLVDRGLVLRDFCLTFVRNHCFILTAPVVLLPVILWDMLHLTHKVAGPLVRFRNALRQLTAGQAVEKIRLRQGDLLTEFQETFNEFLDSDCLQHIQSSKPRTNLVSHFQEDVILKDVAMLDAEMHGERCQPCSPAIR